MSARSRICPEAATRSTCGCRCGASAVPFPPAGGGSSPSACRPSSRPTAGALTHEAQVEDALQMAVEVIPGHPLLQRQMLHWREHPRLDPHHRAPPCPHATFLAALGCGRGALESRPSAHPHFSTRCAPGVDAVVVIQRCMRPSSVIVGGPAYERLVHGYASWHGRPLTLRLLPLALAN